jgi:hypothetical protein
MAIVTIMTQAAINLTAFGARCSRKGVILRAISRGGAAGPHGTGLALGFIQRRHDGS